MIQGPPRPSKLDQYAPDLGRVPDREIAERAGVTPENVRTYRIRRGIPALWRGETAADLAGRMASRGGASAPSSTRYQRRSKILPLRHLLGTVPDREVAEQAGVTPENVRTYRLRRGIPARWRGEQTDGGPFAGADSAAGPRRAYSVIAAVGDGLREYVTFGADITEAARLADARLAELREQTEIREIRLLSAAG